MLTVETVLEGLEKLRSIYPFKNGKTIMRLERSPQTLVEDRLTIVTSDENTGIDITLSLQLKPKDKNNFC
jgi:hypothetical protein